MAAVAALNIEHSDFFSWPLVVWQVFAVPVFAVFVFVVPHIVGQHTAEQGGFVVDSVADGFSVVLLGGYDFVPDLLAVLVLVLVFVAVAKLGCTLNAPALFATHFASALLATAAWRQSYCSCCF